jgi:hypothetical protein
MDELKVILVKMIQNNPVETKLLTFVRKNNRVWFLGGAVVGASIGFAIGYTFGYTLGLHQKK